MTFDPYKLIKYHLYLLQLENYELGRFWKLLNKKGWFPPKEAQRKDLVWTPKAILLFVLAEIIILLLAYAFYLTKIYPPFAYPWQDFLTFVVSVYFLDFFTPIFLSLAAIILWPIDFIAKHLVISEAKGHIAGMKNIKVIGISGSYGKTTMKEVLRQVLGLRFKVQATPESVNTPVGIARWILKEIDDATNIAIIEMGEHYRGDITDICDIAKPDIAVVTGINEAHMERMGNIQNVAATVFEILGGAKQNALVVLNADDSNITANYEKYIRKDEKLEKFSSSVFSFANFDVEKLVWKVKGVIGEFDINLLGEYALGDLDAAIKIAKYLGREDIEIKQGIARIRPVEHRLQPILRDHNILVIDDAYNGNSDGAEEAIKVLARFTNRRKIYITPGLVETGSSVAEVHRKIGQQLASVADVVILIKNSVTGFIQEGIMNGELGIKNGKPKIVWFNTAQDAHAALQTILQPNDVMLFQNDWGDQYL
jgi:UDP-N-acetylmuramoyl-tripeptide--D-alanyl-D-alanine ligase